MLKYILFDLDGTITDPKVGITKSVAYALKKFDINVDNLDSLCNFIGPPLNTSFEEFYGFSPEQAKDAVDKYREYYQEKGIFECELYGGMEQLLKHLHGKGVKIVLATSKPQVFAKRLLEYFNIIKYFDFISGSELNGDRTVKSEVIRYALSQYDGISSDEIIMVGDRKFDYFGAAEFKIPCVLVAYGYGERSELEDCKPYHIVDTVLELENFLDSMCQQG